MKTTNLLFFIAICIIPTICYAQLQVNESEAVSIAIKEYRENGNSRNLSVDTICKLANNRGDTLLYEIMLNDGMAVLVSGNKARAPIIGLYNCRNRPLLENLDNAPCGLRILVKNCMAQIDTLFLDNNRGLSPDSGWTVPFNDTTTSCNTRAIGVGPLIQTKWGQWISNDGIDPIAYNEFAPGEDSCLNGYHCPAGCVAVAMGQVMKYWNYPFFLANSSEVFDWCSMSNQLITTSSCYSTNKEAINRLLKDCGLGVNMNYTCTNSTAYLDDAATTLAYRYLYSSSTSYYKVSLSDIQHSQYTLLSYVRNNLDAGRPVMMCALDATYGGHAFICDGYIKNQYYFNWGWNGDYDGQYDFWGVSPSIYNFNPLTYGIVYNIMPGISFTETGQQLDLTDYYNILSVLIPSILSMPYKIVPTEFSSLISASDTCPISWRTIPANELSVYQAKEEILLRDGFTVEAGADFTAQIVPCPNCETRGEDVIEEELGDTDANSHGADTEGTLNARPSFPQTLADLHPNPTSGELTVTAEGDVQAIVIYNAMGQPVGGWNMLSMAGGRVTLDVSPLPAGNYLLTVRTIDGKTRTGKFVKQ